MHTATHARTHTLLKDLSPKWSHPSLDAVTTEEVETYFRPFDAVIREEKRYRDRQTERERERERKRDGKRKG